MRHPVYTRVTISNTKQHSSNNQKPTITFPINPIKYIYISIPAKHMIQNLSDTRYTCTLVYSHKQHFHCNRKQHNSHINSIITYLRPQITTHKTYETSGIYTSILMQFQRSYFNHKSTR